MKNPDQFAEFIKGFAEAIDADLHEADEQWGWYSRQLDDLEREKVENKGYESGVSEGEGFRLLYPPEPEVHDHTCQQCGAVVVIDCDCPRGNTTNVWCSARCKAAYDL